jgi:3-dehydroquinate dehydratase-2
MAKPTIYVLNGPNLNLLGQREPAIYGRDTLGQIERACARAAKKRGLEIRFRQSNFEGELIGWIQEARRKGGGIIINAGGLSHGSVAILDALLAYGKPVIEVHVSNIYRREKFRRTSLLSRAADGVICGLGAKGYVLAIEAMADMMAK